jgi:hypothetical protein
MFEYIKKVLAGMIILVALANSSQAADPVCTGLVTVDQLWSREGGWVHVTVENMTNMDL